MSHRGSSNKKLDFDETILSELDMLKDMSGKKDKITGLQHCDPSTIEFIRRCLDPNVNFYVTKAPTVNIKSIPNPNVTTIDDAYSVIIDRLASREVSGKMATALVESIAASLGSAGRELLARLLKRDPRCGVGVKTLNTAMGDTLIYVPAYMRCSPFNEKTVSKMGLPVFSQVKMDGLFVNVIIEHDTVHVLTRSGQDITDKVLDASTKAGLLAHGERLEPWVLHGEAVASHDGIINHLMSRESSNGYLNSDDIDPNRVHFFVWDSLSYADFLAGKCAVGYAKRYSSTQKLLDSLMVPDNRFRVLETRTLDSVDAIIDHFKEARKDGEEGVVIKNPDGIWKEGTSKDQIKIKVIFDCDLQVVDLIEGEGKYDGMLGALVVNSACGKVSINIGTGFSDAQRKEFWDDRESLIGEVVAIKANDVTVTSRDDTGEPAEYSLFLPRFVEFRADKTECDDLDRIYEQVLAFTDTLKLLES